MLCLIVVIFCIPSYCATSLVEVSIPIAGGSNINLSTRGPSAFRIRFLYAARKDREPIDTPMVQPDMPDAAFQTVSNKYGTGIASAFGAVFVSPAGVLSLLDRSGQVITRSNPLGLVSNICTSQAADIVSGTRAAAPRTVGSQGECCNACKNTTGCKNWIYGHPGLSYGNCWLMSSISDTKPSKTRTLGGAGAGPGIILSSNGGQLYGGGSGPSDATTLIKQSVTSMVENRMTYVPQYYSTDGYAALGVVNFTSGKGKPNYFPADYSNSDEGVSWTFQGPFELYLMPAPTLDSGTKSYYDLTGAPAVPPRYAFGFMASRWGWQNRSYIESVLKRFRSDNYPIDVFITDFGWFTNVSDYGFNPSGEPWYKDFGYQKDTFPAPKEQLSSYKMDLHFRMGGIRKPRLGNTALLNYTREKGWIFPGGELERGTLGGHLYADQRCINYTIPEAREWYAQQQQHYFADGVSFFWNDEGETDFFTFYWWNVAQIQSLRMTEEFRSTRFFSINRAWSPGMARLGATVSTGDIHPSWEDLQGTPGMLLNWGLSGAPYVTCDIGGFTDESNGHLLTRWMQLGAFLPIMRVHSTHSATPHFPWLWAGFENYLRTALNLRYQLLPYHYSLAMTMYRTNRLMMRPLAAEFPGDRSAAGISSQYFDGDLLVAAVLREDDQKQVYLPEGFWYSFNSSTTTSGPANVTGHADLSEIPVFVRPGSIIPLAPIIQYSDALPGGALEIQVYEGADGKFVLYEDDGDTVSYTAGAVRETSFFWGDEEKRLSWTVAKSDMKLPHAFQKLFVKAFSSLGVKQSEAKFIGSKGSITMREAVIV